MALDFEPTVNSVTVALGVAEVMADEAGCHPAIVASNVQVAGVAAALAAAAQHNWQCEDRVLVIVDLDSGHL